MITKNVSFENRFKFNVLVILHGKQHYICGVATNLCDVDEKY